MIVTASLPPAPLVNIYSRIAAFGDCYRLQSSEAHHFLSLIGKEKEELTDNISIILDKVACYNECVACNILTWQAKERKRSKTLNAETIASFYIMQINKSFYLQKMTVS